MLHVRICAGGRPQGWSLPRQSFSLQAKRADGSGLNCFLLHFNFPGLFRIIVIPVIKIPDCLR